LSGFVKGFLKIFLALARAYAVHLFEDVGVFLAVSVGRIGEPISQVCLNLCLTALREEAVINRLGSGASYTVNNCESGHISYLSFLITCIV
jgi:hypothetical protein